MPRIYEGQEVRIYTSPVFKDEAEVAADPDTVTITVQKPNGAETVYTYPASVTKLATGSYEKRVTPSTGEAGIWQAEIRGVNPNAVAIVQWRVHPAI